jgi:hypothetical protein
VGAESRTQLVALSESDANAIAFLPETTRISRQRASVLRCVDDEVDGRI